MTKQELDQWYQLQQQVANDWHLSDQDKKDLIRLNYLVREIASKIHNKSMLEWTK